MRERAIPKCFYFNSTTFGILAPTRRVAHTSGGVKIPLLLPTLLSFNDSPHTTRLLSGDNNVPYWVKICRVARE
ncbi:MAG TPA: hypothetical protein V6C93_25445 [Allocoleopsis sp.]